LRLDALAGVHVRSRLPLPALPRRSSHLQRHPPQADLPEVGGLASEGGAVDLAGRGKLLRVVPSEVAVEWLVGVDAKEFSDDLDGENLRIGELWDGAALADTSSFEVIVRQTQDGYDEGAKIHERPPLRPVH